VEQSVGFLFGRLRPCSQIIDLGKSIYLCKHSILLFKSRSYRDLKFMTLGLEHRFFEKLSRSLSLSLSLPLSLSHTHIHTLSLSFQFSTYSSQVGYDGLLQLKEVFRAKNDLRMRDTQSGKGRERFLFISLSFSL